MRDRWAQQLKSASGPRPESFSLSSSLRVSTSGAGSKNGAITFVITAESVPTFAMTTDQAPGGADAAEGETGAPLLRDLSSRRCSERGK